MLVALATLVAGGPRAWAAGLTATVDRAQASVGEQITLSVTVDGSRSAEPTLPDLAAFEIHGRGHSAQVQLINGHMSSRVAYNYALLPKRAGTFTIGAARVEVDGKIYQSDPFTVTITNTPAAEAGGNAPVFITAEVSNTTPYVGEQVVYTWRFYSHVRYANLGNLVIPDFEGFMSRELGDKREYDTVTRNQSYRVIEFRRVLVPQEPVHAILPASSVQVDVFSNNGNRRGDDMFGSPFDAFFDRGQRQTRVLRSTPIDLRVQPLPAPPAGFTGLVGNFQIGAQLSQSVLQVGDSATLTVTVNGNGDVQHVQEPPLDLQGFKIYDDKPVSQTNVQGSALMGTKVFKKALVPTQAGEFIVPPIALTYFDPQARAYKTSATQAFTLHVSGGSAAAAPAGGAPNGLAAPLGKQDVQVLGDDILPIYKRLDALDDQRFRGSHEALWAAAFALPPVAFLAFAIWQRRREGMSALQAGRRRRTALKRSLQAVSQVRAGLKKGGVQQAAALASRTVRDYLSAKLSIEGRAMTPMEARALLQARGTKAQLASEVEEYLGRCEAAQYGTAPGGTSVFAPLADDLQKLLTKLDKGLRL